MRHRFAALLAMIMAVVVIETLAQRPSHEGYIPGL